MHKVIPVLPLETEKQIKLYIQQRNPFILEGPAGSGKSLAARHWTKEITGSEAIIIDITEDTERVHILGDIGWRSFSLHSADTDNSERTVNPETSSEYYLPSGAVTAMQQGRVLIIEGMDSCRRDTLFPVLSDMIEYRQMYVPALGRQLDAKEGFNVVITVCDDTAAGTSRLPDAFLRRCRRLVIPNPDFDTELQIVLANLPEASQTLVEQIVRLVQRLRKIKLQHQPAPSETVHWVSDLINLFGANLDRASPEQLQLTLSAICKAVEDEEQILTLLGVRTNGYIRKKRRD